MLNAHGAALAFRHELARRAIQDAASPLRARDCMPRRWPCSRAATTAAPRRPRTTPSRPAAIEDLVAYRFAPPMRPQRSARIARPWRT